ncbi:2-hydroxyacid dehydrogenase [Kineococcus sp. SYSU DK002]|uniref:2-hydroxyacid dehydrogenase n=1 Tax=Kineococcus sp. SYSU DK002 TaxID=3383123 RepID=UPI003D7C9475
MSALEVLVTEPVLGRFTDVLTRDGASPHRWTFGAGPERSPDVLVCSAATPAQIAALPDLRLVQVTGAGVDKVPALPPDVLLANTSHHGRSIAEHVLTVTSVLRRGLLTSDREVREGRWRNAVVTDGFPFGRLWAGARVGIVGFGGIGREVARLALAVGMSVRAVRRDPHAPRPDDLRAVRVEGDDALHDLLAGSDVVVVTVPLDESTRGLVGAAELAAMPGDAVLVNVARGPVVDEQALHDALRDGTIGGAAIDVWWRDPRDRDAPPPSHLDFTGFGNVVLTPHQSGHTEETFRARAQDVTDNVDALAAGRPLRNLVVR